MEGPLTSLERYSNRRGFGEQIHWFHVDGESTHVRKKMPFGLRENMGLNN